MDAPSDARRRSPVSKRGSPSLVRDVGSAVLSSTASSLPVFLVGALAVQMLPSLHLSLAELGLAVSTYYLAASLGSIPGGRLAEWFGGARTIRVATVISALCLVLLASAGSWATLVAFLALAGVAGIMIQPATNLFLLRRVPIDRQGLAFGIKQASVPFATLLGGLAVPGIGLTLGWRWAFLMAAVVGVAAALLVPRSRVSLSARRRAPRPWTRGRLRPLLVLSIGFGLGVFAATSLTAFLVTSAVAAGLGKAAAGLVAALSGAVAVTVRILVGLQADRRGRGHLPVVAIMLASGVIGYAGLALGSADHVGAVFVAGAVVAYGAGWGWNGLFNFAIASSHPHAPAWASGVTQTGGRLAGVVGPLVFGLVATRSSYMVGWLVSAGAALAAAAVMLLGRRLLGAQPVTGLVELEETLSTDSAL